MKKLLLLSLLVITPGFSLADMRYDPIGNRFYSDPDTYNINQGEYHNLCLQCAQIYTNMKIFSAPGLPSFNDIFYHCSLHLQSVGTQTAFRLIADIQKNIVHYKNGSYLGRFF